MTAFAVFMLLSSSIFAQTRDWDSILDRYESIYAECVSMKAKVADGGRVSKRKLASLLEELSVLRSTIQESAGDMNGKQRARFAQIRARYSGESKANVQKMAVQASPVVPRNVKPETAVFPSSAGKNVPDILPVVSDSVPIACERAVFAPLPSACACTSFPAETDIQAPVFVRSITSASEEEKKERSFDWSLSLLTGLYPDMSGGAMLAFCPSSKPLGAYISFRSDFRPLASSYKCLSDGTSDGYELWLSGASRRHRAMAAAGPVLRLSERMSVYAGMGYGSFIYSWEDVDGNWAEVSDYSCRGFSCEAGLLYDIGRCRIGAGVGVTALRYSDLELSVGLRF